MLRVSLTRCVNKRRSEYKHEEILNDLMKNEPCLFTDKNRREKLNGEKPINTISETKIFKYPFLEQITNQ